MTTLAKIAALATIIGTVFIIYIYYKNDISIPIIPELKERDKISGSRQSSKPEQKESSYCETLIREIELLPTVNLDELKGRHKAAKEIPLSADRSEALFSVMKICLKNKQFDHASNVAKDIPFSSARSDAYMALAVLLAYNGHFEKAISVAKKIPLSKTRSIALKEISTIRKNPELVDQNKLNLHNQQLKKDGQKPRALPAP